MLDTVKNSQKTTPKETTAGSTMASPVKKLAPPPDEMVFVHAVV